jgi:transposase InsO family protein
MTESLFFCLISAGFFYTRQAYYKHLRRNREGSLSDTLLLERVGYYRKLMPRLGGRKLWHLLQQDGFPVSRDRLFTLLSENNLLVKRRKKYSVTTCSRHWMRKYPNLIRGFDLERPHQFPVATHPLQKKGVGQGSFPITP